MKFDRFTTPCECSMKHEKPESFPDDYKPQCECHQSKPSGAFKTEHWFSVGYAERKANETVKGYVSFGVQCSTFEAARNHLSAVRLDYDQRGIDVPPDEFCVIEHTETFYLV